MTQHPSPPNDYRAARVDRLKDLEYAAATLETALGCADEDGCTDGFQYTISDLVEALGTEKVRELLGSISTGRPEYKVMMIEIAQKN